MLGTARRIAVDAVGGPDPDLAYRYQLTDARDVATLLAALGLDQEPEQACPECAARTTLNIYDDHGALGGLTFECGPLSPSTRPARVRFVYADGRCAAIEIRDRKTIDAVLAAHRCSGLPKPPGCS